MYFKLMNPTETLGVLADQFAGKQIAQPASVRSPCQNCY